MYFFALCIAFQKDFCDVLYLLTFDVQSSEGANLWMSFYKPPTMKVKSSALMNMHERNNQYSHFL